MACQTRPCCPYCPGSATLWQDTLLLSSPASSPGLEVGGHASGGRPAGSTVLDALGAPTARASSKSDAWECEVGEDVGSARSAAKRASTALLVRLGTAVATAGEHGSSSTGVSGGVGLCWARDGGAPAVRGDLDTLVSALAGPMLQPHQPALARPLPLQAAGTPSPASVIESGVRVGYLGFEAAREGG